MTENDTVNFWKSCRTLYAKNKSHLPPVVDGNSSKEAIAESFCETFEKTARPNNQRKFDEVDAKFLETHKRLSSNHESNCDCDKYECTIENIFDCAMQLKNRKASDDDGISAEHFLNAPYIVFVALKQLFNGMLRHSFVPSQFSLSTILPILKDQHSNRSDVNNYRGITISPIASKIFEHVLKMLFGKFMSSVRGNLVLNAKTRHCM